MQRLGKILLHPVTLLLALLITLSACGGSSTGSAQPTPTARSTGTVNTTAVPTDTTTVTGFTPTPEIPSPTPTPTIINIPGISATFPLNKVMYSTLKTNWADWFAIGQGWTVNPETSFTFQGQTYTVTAAVQDGSDNGMHPPSWKTNTVLLPVANYTVVVTVQYGDSLGCTDIADLLFIAGKGGYKISPNCDGYNELRPVLASGDIGQLTVGVNQIPSSDQPGSIHTFFAWHTAKDQVCFAEDNPSHYFCMPTDHSIAAKSGGQMGANSAQTPITLLQYSVVNWTPT